MSKEVIVGDNVFLDIIIDAASDYGDDLFTYQTVHKLYHDYYNFLSFKLRNKKDIDYLDFDIETDESYDLIDIKPNNIITALWFLNVYPEERDFPKITEKNVYAYMGKIYRFDTNTRKIKIKKRD